MDAFFSLKTPDEVFKIIRSFKPVDHETVVIEKALGRVLHEDLISPEDLPDFFKSTMDGYAVSAKSTFGATESLPALLELAGEVQMGVRGDIALRPGEAVRIPTGGMLPEGADGVVMLEYCHLLDESTLEVNRTVSPLENVIVPGDDFKKGASILARGKRLRPQDLGVLAGLGFCRIPVFKRPRVGILSSGDEIIPVSKKPEPGQVRDINRYTLGALCRNMGAVPVDLGICSDNFDVLRETVASCLSELDALWISGGSSVGTRDLTLKVFETLPEFELLVHGICVSPGKPTIIGRSGAKPVIGLPGHPASALIIAEVFMTGLLTALSGIGKGNVECHAHRKAFLSQNVASSPGREDYVRVKLTRGKDGLQAIPVFGKSGLISTLVEADGLMKIGMHTEGVYQGDEIDVMLFSRAIKDFE